MHDVTEGTTPRLLEHRRPRAKSSGDGRGRTYSCARRPSIVIQGRDRRATKHRPTSHLGGDIVGLSVYYLVEIQSSNGLFGSVQRRVQRTNITDISSSKRWTLTKIHKRRLERGEESWASALILNLTPCGGTSALGKQHTKHPTPDNVNAIFGSRLWLWQWQ